MAECVADCKAISKCDIFDFMAKYVELTIVHPGGFDSTRQLPSTLQVRSDSKVIDISAELIEEAKQLARRRGLSGKMRFMVCDAMQLPFEDGSFDAAISQAMLVLVDDKIRAIKEASRVIKHCGAAGWL